MTILQSDVDYMIILSKQLTETSKYAAELVDDLENILVSKYVIQKIHIEALVSEIEALHLESEVSEKFKPLFDESEISEKFTPLPDEVDS